MLISMENGSPKSGLPFFVFIVKNLLYFYIDLIIGKILILSGWEVARPQGHQAGGKEIR